MWVKGCEAGVSYCMFMVVFLSGVYSVQNIRSFLRPLNLLDAIRHTERPMKLILFIPFLICIRNNGSLKKSQSVTLQACLYLYYPLVSFNILADFASIARLKMCAKHTVRCLFNLQQGFMQSSTQLMRQFGFFCHLKIRFHKMWIIKNIFFIKHSSYIRNTQCVCSVHLQSPLILSQVLTFSCRLKITRLTSKYYLILIFATLTGFF